MPRDTAWGRPGGAAAPRHLQGLLQPTGLCGDRAASPQLTRCPQRSTGPRGAVAGRRPGRRAGRRAEGAGPASRGAVPLPAAAEGQGGVGRARRASLRVVSARRGCCGTAARRRTRLPTSLSERVSERSGAGGRRRRRRGLRGGSCRLQRRGALVPPSAAALARVAPGWPGRAGSSVCRAAPGGRRGTASSAAWASRCPGRRRRPGGACPAPGLGVLLRAGVRGPARRLRSAGGVLGFRGSGREGSGACPAGAAASRGEPGRACPCSGARAPFCWENPRSVQPLLLGED